MKRRTLFVTSRSITRFRCAVAKAEATFGGRNTAKHGFGFNAAGKHVNMKDPANCFAVNKIRMHDFAKQAKARRAIDTAKRMATKIHRGSITGRSGRRFGCRFTKSNTTVAMGSSACTINCQTINTQNRRRKDSSRIKPISVNKLDGFLRSIVTQGWANIPIGCTAHATTVKTFVK